MAESASAVTSRQIFGRAAFWYSEAIPKLQGFTLAKARDRVRTAYQKFPGLEYGSVAGVSPFAPYAGAWEIRYANGFSRLYVMDSRGNAFLINNGGIFVGRMTPLPDQEQMLLVFPTLPKERGRTERLSIKGGEMLVQHFNPPTRLSTTGVGKKHELPERKPTGVGDVPSNFRDVAGIWFARHSNRMFRIYVLGPKGTGQIVAEDYVQEGVLKRKEDHILFDCSDNKLERIKLLGGRLAIDSFDPSNTYPGGQPKAVAVAVRLSR